MSDRSSLPIEANPEVPSFGCIVYLSPCDDGVRARVANLDGIAVTASSESAALRQIVPEFKRIVKSYLDADQPVPWIDPPVEMAVGEQKRFLPTHL